MSGGTHNVITLRVGEAARKMWDETVDAVIEDSSRLVLFEMRAEGTRLIMTIKQRAPHPKPRG